MEQSSNYIYILSIYIYLYFVNFTFLLYKQSPFLLVWAPAGSCRKTESAWDHRRCREKV